MKSKRERFFMWAGLCLFFFSANAIADEGQYGQLVRRDPPDLLTEYWSFHSPSMQRGYDISVALPTGYEAAGQATFPALMVVDGNRMFGMTVDLSRGLIQSQAIEDLFIISIGTPFEEGQEAWVQRRIHEFSPNNDRPLTDSFGQILKQLCDQRYKIPIEDCIGGAPKFLKFINDELLPQLKARYRLDGDRLGLFGVSAGGFFASWTLLNDSSPFSRYIISSPAMAYGDGEIGRLEAKWAAAHDDLSARVYMAAGMLETNTAFEEGTGKIVSGMAEFSGMLALRNYPNLLLTTELHPGLGHSDAAGATLAIGLRRLYGREKD